MELGIKGNETHGDEIIKILEMLGGKNRHEMRGSIYNNYFYYIDDEYKDISYSYIGSDKINRYKIFSLDEFLEKFPYKVGDKVNVWVNHEHFSGPRAELEVAEIKSMRWNSARCEIAYRLKNISGEFYKNDIKGKVEEENKPEPKFKVGDTVYSTTWQQDVIIQEIFPDGFYKVSDLQCSGWFKTHEDALRKEKITLPIDSHLLTKQFKQEILLPEGYQFVDDNGNIINTKKIKLVKNSPSYPKSYEECCDVIGINRHEVEIDIPRPYQQNMFNLFKLLICRDAYWKIAGEQMGLGKPWEPDWNDNNQPKFGIHNVQNDIRTINLRVLKNLILVFPTEEMRDVFYNNFKNLIEKCNKLL
jgi:hypothetical protein